MLSVVVASFAALLGPAQDDAPSQKEAEKLVAEYYATDWKTVDGMKRHDEILRELELVAPLDDKSFKSWNKKLDKLWKKGPKLAKTGRNHLWEDDKRGLSSSVARRKSPRDSSSECMAVARVPVMPAIVTVRSAEPQRVRIGLVFFPRCS